VNAADPRESARRLLLAALDPDGERVARVAATEPTSIDWAWLIERVRFHKIGALVAARLREHGLLARLEPGVRTDFEDITRLAQTRLERAGSTLRQVSEAYRELDIPFLVVKGGVLSELVYGEPSLRPFYDLDLVVPEEHVDRAGSVLLEMGYFFYLPSWLSRKGAARDDMTEAEARRLMRAHHRHFSYVLREDDPRLPVELHWHVLNPETSPIRPETIWERTVPMEVHGVAVRTLDLAPMLVHVAAHAMEQGRNGFRLLHLCDAAWIVARLIGPEQLDGIRATARAWDAERDLACALIAARWLFPFELPESASGLAGRRPASELCMKLAGLYPFLVDQEGSGGRVRRLAEMLWRECCWDLALGRVPVRAARTLSDAVSRRLDRAHVRAAETD
jgi:hypothetical protein